MSVPEQPAVFGEWSQLEGSFSVRYPREVFTEIEFLVKDGSRRIAHGGIEVGGLLFGRVTSERGRQWVQIEAFRSIDCEHAFGPSFVLSDRDLTAMREQLLRDGSDSELEGMQLLGWFIGHARNPLRLTDHEATLFDKLFPKPGQLTLLIKPERFNPSRFALLIRGADRTVERDATGPEQSFELPAARRAAEPSSAEPVNEPKKVEIESTAPPPFAYRENPAGSNEHVQPTTEQASAEKERTAADALRPWEPTVAIPAMGVQASAMERLAAAELRTPAEPAFTQQMREAARAELPSADEIRRRRMERAQRSRVMEAPDSFAEMREPTAEGILRRPGLGSTAVLLLVLLLGCAAGYWIYLQFFAPPIALEIEPQPSGVVVTWGPEQTAGTAPATLKVGEAEPRALTVEEKELGRAEVRVDGFDTRIELVVHHWMHDSKGIVRYVRAGLPAMP